MKTSAKVIVGGLILFALGTGACSSNNNNEKPESSSKKSLNTTSPQDIETANEESKQVATIDDSIAKIGMTCQSSGETEFTCTWNGKEYRLTKPTSWTTDESLRKQACDQGYINRNYQILSDEASFHIGTDFNEDLQTLNTALIGADAKVAVVAYCPQ